MSHPEIAVLKINTMALGLYTAIACLCLFLAILAADIMGIFAWKNHFEVDGRVREVIVAISTAPLTGYDRQYS